MPPADTSIAPPRGAAVGRTLLPYLALVTTMMGWAGNWVIGRAVRDAMPPFALNFWRWTVALLVVAPFALPGLRGKGAVIRRHWRLLAALSVTGVTMFQALVYSGLSITPVVNAVLLNSAAPLFIILCAWLMDGDRATLRQIAGMAISFAGIVAIMLRGDLAALLQLRFAVGDAVILAAMPVWGVYSVLLKQRPREIDGIGLLFVTGAIGLALTAPLYAIESVFIRQPVFALTSAGAVIYIGVVASVVAFGCWNYGVAAVGPNRAGFTMHLLPAFGTAAGILFLGEPVHIYHGVGFAMIFAGVTIATSARARVRD